MRYLLAFLTALIVLGTPAHAHVGSPDIFFEGNAGPYRLFVTVRVPQVIPGIAEVQIRSESSDVDRVTIAPMQLTGPGSHFAPTPDVAQRSKTDPQSFAGSVWLMEFGSLQVRVEAEGERGEGSIAVPVPAIAQHTLPMRRPLGVLLFSLMLVLAFALVSIVAAAVREGSLQPGASAKIDHLHRGRKAMVIASVVIAGLLYVGREWWQSDANLYARNVYSPPQIAAEIDSGGRLVLSEKPTRIAAGNPGRPSDLADFAHLILDHNHLMHLFLIRTPGMDSFWHLHPEQDQHGQFALDLPALPPGHYKLFADVVLSSGFPVTMVGELDVSSVRSRPLTGDDSAASARPLEQASTQAAVAPLTEGDRMIWERSSGESIRHNVPLSLQFRIEDSAGKPVHDLEPYMGMAAHAEIIRSDGSVFAHIHPAGSVSMAALGLAQAGVPRSLQAPADDGMAMMNMANGPVDSLDSSGPNVSFPYGFPQPGVYRIFVQVKRLGRIETGVFDISVE